MTYLSLKKSLRVIRCCLPAAIRSRVFHTPLWVHLYLTRRCNLDCSYCHIKDNTKKDLSTADIKRIIDKLYSLGIRAIAFFGGEPTLRRDFCEILEYSASKGIFSYFTTNGTLLDEAYIKRIANTGVDYIELSIDSIIGFEGSKKQYSQVKNTISLLLKYRASHGFGLKTHLVLNNKNLDNVIPTIKRIDKLGIPLTIGYIGRSTEKGKQDDETLFFNNEKSKQKLVETVDRIIELKRSGALVMDPYPYFDGMKRFVFGGFKWNCAAGIYAFSVDHDGSVQLCPGLRPYDTNILEMAEDFFKVRADDMEKTKKWCTTLCYAACHNTAAYMIEHPILALMGR